MKNFFFLTMCVTTLFVKVSFGQCITHSEFKKDLEFLVDNLEKTHPNPYWRTSKASFDSIKNYLVNRDIKLTCEDVYVSVLRIMALTQDGHNDVYPPSDWKEFQKKLPIKINKFSDGLYIVAASKKNSNLIGNKVLAIGGVKIDNATKLIEDVVIADNKFGKKELFEDYIIMPAILKALKLTKNSNQVNFTLENQDRNIFEVSIKSITNSKLTGPGPPRRLIPESWLGISKQHQGPWQQNLNENYWFTFLDSEKTVYFQFQKVRNNKRESFQDFNQRLFDFIKNNPVKRLVIDLRWNRGGNAYLLQPFLHELIRSKKLGGPESLFVLISNYTFSAAITLAVEIEKHTHAIFLGQPTAAGPNYNAEAKSFFLPNSGIEIETSTSFWQLSDPRDKRAWLQPDIEIPFTFKDYMQDIDRVFRSIFKFNSSNLKKEYDRLPGYNWSRKSQKIARLKD